jgi:HAD superfamily hydrolase (TIGR01484 family)
MEPFADIDRRVLERISGLAFDIDDTVTRGGRLEPIAFDAMWRAHDAGLALFAVTGRPLGWADVIVRHWPVDGVVAENGAGWILRDRDGEFSEGYFERDRSTYPDRFAAIVSRVGRELPHVKLAVDQRARRADLAFDIGEHEHLEPADIDRLREVVLDEGARALLSTVHLHVLLGGWDKGVASERAIEAKLGRFEPERWVFVGDSENDRAAFERFGWSVGVGNVRAFAPRLGGVPRFVTRADRGMGFAEVAGALAGARAVFDSRVAAQ